MKKLLSVMGVILAVFAGLMFAGPANAATPRALASHASAPALTATTATATAPSVLVGPTPMTGNYYYNCVLTDGNSWSLAAGEPLTDCHGSYLQKYLDGVHVSSIALTYGGGAAASESSQWHTLGCAVAVASGVVLVLYPPTEALEWILATTAYAGGGAIACLA